MRSGQSANLVYCTNDCKDAHTIVDTISRRITNIWVNTMSFVRTIMSDLLELIAISPLLEVLHVNGEKATQIPNVVFPKAWVKSRLESDGGSWNREIYENQKQNRGHLY